MNAFVRSFVRLFDLIHLFHSSILFVYFIRLFRSFDFVHLILFVTPGRQCAIATFLAMCPLYRWLYSLWKSVM